MKPDPLLQLFAVPSAAAAARAPFPSLSRARPVLRACVRGPFAVLSLSLCLAVQRPPLRLLQRGIEGGGRQQAAR